MKQTDVVKEALKKIAEKMDQEIGEKTLNIATQLILSGDLIVAVKESPVLGIDFNKNPEALELVMEQNVYYEPYFGMIALKQENERLKKHSFTREELEDIVNDLDRANFDIYSKRTEAMIKKLQEMLKNE